MGCHFFLQGIFPTQRWNLHLLHWQADSLPLSHQGSSENMMQNYNSVKTILQKPKQKWVIWNPWVMWGLPFFHHRPESNSRKPSQVRTWPAPMCSRLATEPEQDLLTLTQWNSSPRTAGGNLKLSRAGLPMRTFCSGQDLPHPLLSSVVATGYVWVLAMWHSEAEELSLKFLKSFFFNWGIVDLQCCINFKCTAKWISYMYT